MRGHTDALRRLASRHYELGDREGAEHVARQAVMTNDYHPLVSLAHWLENDGDQAGADRLRQEAADHADLDALGELVQQRIESGDLSEAEDLALIASDFGHVQPIVELAEHCEAVGEIETAKRMYLEAADHWDVRALLRLAEWEVEAGDRAEADEIFARISTTGDSLELMLLAMTRERIGDRDVAREIYYRLVSLDEPIAYDELCRLAIEDGDHATAFNLAVEAAKDGYHDPLDQIADRVAESAGQASADDLYRQDGDAGLLVVLGRRRAANGERAEATALFEEAATSEDETAQRLALLELCMLRISAQEFEEAEHLARQAVDSTDSFALEMLADELAKAGQYETAELLYRELLNSGHQCLNDLAAVYHLKGRPDTAHQIRMYGLTADGQIAAPWSM